METPKAPREPKKDNPTEPEKIKGVKKKVLKKKPTDSILLKDLFEVYKAWKGLPAIWRGMSPKKLAELGIEDPVIIELLSVKNQTQFAQKYNLDINTPGAWNKKLMEEGKDYLEETRKWARLFTKNVVAAHYRKVIKRFDPMSGELWYKVIEGFSDKKLVEHSGKMSLVDLAKQVADDETTKPKSNTENKG